MKIENPIRLPARHAASDRSLGLTAGAALLAAATGALLSFPAVYSPEPQPLEIDEEVFSLRDAPAPLPQAASARPEVGSLLRSPSGRPSLSWSTFAPQPASTRAAARPSVFPGGLQARPPIGRGAAIGETPEAAARGGWLDRLGGRGEQKLANLKPLGGAGSHASNGAPLALGGRAPAERDAASLARVPAGPGGVGDFKGPSPADRLKSFLKRLPAALSSGLLSLARGVEVPLTPFAPSGVTGGLQPGFGIAGSGAPNTSAGPSLPSAPAPAQEAEGDTKKTSNQGGGAAGADPAGNASGARGADYAWVSKAISSFHENVIVPGVRSLKAAEETADKEVGAAIDALSPFQAAAAARQSLQGQQIGLRAAGACLTQTDASALAACDGTLEPALVTGLRARDAQLSDLRQAASANIPPADELARAVISARTSVGKALGAWKDDPDNGALEASEQARGALDAFVARLDASGAFAGKDGESLRATLAAASANLRDAAAAWEDSRAPRSTEPGAATQSAVKAIIADVNAELLLRKALASLNGTAGTGK